MAAIFAFRCTCCGRVHEGSPSIGYEMPDQYACLSEEQRAAMGRISNDLCTITHEDGTDHFIRAVLEVPIHGVEEPFVWGVWVSLSVLVQLGGRRPKVILHRADCESDPLVIDQVHGISISRAQEIAERCQHRD